MNQNTELLRLLNLPVISSFQELANETHISAGQLRFLIFRNSKFYRTVFRFKRSGSLRTIRCPNAKMKALQAWVLRNILDKLTTSTHATAFKKGVGLIDNVKPHAENRFYLCLDIKNFFDSIHFGRVFHLFRTLGYSNRTAWMLTQVCTCEGSLPQGGVTSPALANLIASKLDRRLSGFVGRRNIVYTRYADDMTFSARNPKALLKTRTFIEKIISEERFLINEKKSRTSGPKLRTQVTGLIKNASKPGFGIGRQKRREMRAVMHRFGTSGKVTSDYPTRESIDGWLCFLKSVDDVCFRNMLAYWKKIAPET